MSTDRAPSDGQDIVERLREAGSFFCTKAWMEEAAAEIQRLRAELAEVKHWNGAIAVCQEHVEDVVSEDPASCVVCDLERLRAELTSWQGPWRAGYPMEGAHLRPSDGEPCEYVGLPCNKCGRAALSEQEPGIDVIAYHEDNGTWVCRTPEVFNDMGLDFDPTQDIRGRLRLARTQSPKEGDDA